jgi:hypothetical protein
MQGKGYRDCTISYEYDIPGMTYGVIVASTITKEPLLPWIPRLQREHPVLSLLLLMQTSTLLRAFNRRQMPINNLPFARGLKSLLIKKYASMVSLSLLLLPIRWKEQHTLHHW